MSEPVRTKINASYAYGAMNADGTATPEAGVACAMRTVEQHTGLPIRDAAVLDLEGVAQGVNGLGGVKMCVEDDYPQGPSFGNISPGCQILSGEQARDYARMRKGVGDGSDLDRIDRQHQVLMALARQMQSLRLPQDLPTLMGIYNGLSEHMAATGGLRSPTFIGDGVRAVQQGQFATYGVPVEFLPDGANVAWTPEAAEWWAAIKRGQDIPAPSR